ncbi:MAG: chromate transporter [Bacteroidetes bacterium]|nr:chromate transporter [Bacteroidota bacterium]
MFFRRHIDFLKAVLLHAMTSFGGPQGHFSMMLKIFVERRNDISEKQLHDFNAFCQLLPGASSTQILILIGYKKGGLPLSILTLLLWILPAATFMGIAAIILTAYPSNSKVIDSIQFLPPIAIGFIGYAAWRSYQIIRKKVFFIILTLFIIVICLTFFKQPIIFPIVIFVASLITIFFYSEQIATNEQRPITVRWKFLTIFLLTFLVSGSLSELARKNNWGLRPYFNLFENGYRFGSIIFGGGDVLIPLMYEQYVARPTSKKIKENNSNALKMDRTVFLAGAGFIRAVPGPVFSFASFAGASVLISKGSGNQWIGMLVATVAIFLPSFLLVLFFYPLWEYLHGFNFLYPLLKGIHAATVGIMFASVIYLSTDLLYIHYSSIEKTLSSIFFICITLIYLSTTKLNPAWLVIGSLILGYFSSYPLL